MTSVIAVYHLLLKRDQVGLQQKLGWAELLCLHVFYLWACAAGGRGGVVGPRRGQVVTAALPPQTLDIKGWLPP